MQTQMLISREKGRYKAIDGEKVRRGSFFTKGASWLLPQVVEFMQAGRPQVILDPFAGGGDLLRAAEGVVSAECRGLDIAPGLGWAVNDSLQSIPALADGLIVTNPPFLARNSAKRKRVFESVEKYFGRWEDIYQTALDKCLEAAPRVVAIVPETFINSIYPKDGCVSISILEENPFDDTDCPVCVLCMERGARSLADVSIYRGAEKLGSLAHFESMRLRPLGRHEISFNVPQGEVGLRAVDLPDPAKPIRFYMAEDLDYPVEKILHSSRLVTRIAMPGVPSRFLPTVVARANGLLSDFRMATQDCTLSPFKGNTKDGSRRRRLDYSTCRAILERAMEDVLPAQQMGLFGGGVA